MQIEVDISRMPDGSEEFNGFTYIWLKYVNGFKSQCHCQESLIGKIEEEFDKKMKIGRTILLKDSG